MRKLSSKQIEEIKELYKNGMSQSEISKKYLVRPSAIAYHTLKSARKRMNERRKIWYSKLNKEERHNLYSKNKKYSANYLKNRYKNDPDFRAKQQERAREYKRGKKK